MILNDLIETKGWESAARTIAASPDTHYLVTETLEKALTKDPVDAYYDVLTVCEILKARMETILGPG